MGGLIRKDPGKGDQHAPAARNVLAAEPQEVAFHGDRRMPTPPDRRVRATSRDPPAVVAAQRLVADLYSAAPRILHPVDGKVGVAQHFIGRELARPAERHADRDEARRGAQGHSGPEILAAAVRPRVIMLTTFDADEMVHRALRAGADGFLLKDTPPERIVESIRAVSRGEPTLSPTVTARLIAAVTEAPDPGGSAARATARRRLEALTAREREVALAIGGGASNADIAGTLFMSVATVKSHVTSILAKTGAESRLQVAVLVRDAEL